MKDTWNEYIGIKFGIERTDDFNPDSESDKVKLTDDITKMRKKSDTPKEFYDILTSYFKDRPIVTKLMNKSIDTMASEVTALSILKVIANEEPDFMRTLLKEPRIIVKFGREIKRMAKNNGLDGEGIRLAISGDGDVVVGDDVGELERNLQESGDYKLVDERLKSSSYVYKELLDLDDTPDVSLRDIDTHLEGQA